MTTTSVTARTGYGGKQYHYEQTAVSLTTGANTSDGVSFDVPYQDSPDVRVVAIWGTGGTADGAGGHPNFKVQSVTKSGFTWNITGTGLGNVTANIVWFAHEQM